MAEISLGVKVWGDVKELISGLKKGGQGVDEFTSKSGGKFAELSRAFQKAGLIYKNVAAEFGPNSPEAKAAMKNFQMLRENMDDITKSMKPAGGAFDSVKSSIMGAAGSMFTIAGSVALVKEGFDLLKSTMSATDAGALTLEANTAAVSTALSVVKDRAALVLDGSMKLTDAFKGLGDQMKSAGLAADAYTRAMDAISDRNDAFVGQEARMRNEIAKLRFAAADQTKSEKERKDALQKSLDLEQKIVEFKKTQAKAAYDQEVKAMAARFFVSDKVIKGLIEGDEEWVTKTVANNKAAANAWNKLFGAGGEGKQLSSLYADWINADTAYFEQNKKTQGKVTGFMDSIATATENALDVTLEYAKVLAAIAGGTFVGPAAPQNMGDMTQNQFGGELGTGKLTPFAAGSVSTGVKRGLYTQASGQTEQENTANKILSMKTAIEQVTQSLSGLGQGFQQTFAAIGNIFVKFKEGFKGGWKEATAAALELASGAVSMISGLFSQSSERRIQELDDQYNAQRDSIERSKMSENAKKKALDRLDADSAKKRKELMRQQAKDQKVTSVMQAIIGGALAVVNALSVPLVGVALAVIVGALAAAQIATIIAQPLPALAGGGLAMAPTLAMVGDNKNARIDPEVIAPLSKLKEMLFGAGDSGEVKPILVLRGDDLYYSQQRVGRKLNRI